MVCLKKNNCNITVKRQDNTKANLISHKPLAASLCDSHEEMEDVSLAVSQAHDNLILGQWRREMAEVLAGAAAVHLQLARLTLTDVDVAPASTAQVEAMRGGVGQLHMVQVIACQGNQLWLKWCEEGTGLVDGHCLLEGANSLNAIVTSNHVYVIFSGLPPGP